jgi:hypothetical protein
VSAFSVKRIFARDFEHYEGVRRLVVVAYPMWSTGTLAGSRAEGIALSFLPVILPILAMPWGYVLRTHVWPSLSRRRV